MSVVALSNPIVLGVPWLVLHNPVIDWKQAAIISWSVRSAVTPGLDSASPPPEPSDLSSIQNSTTWQRYLARPEHCLFPLTVSTIVPQTCCLEHLLPPVASTSCPDHRKRPWWLISEILWPLVWFTLLISTKGWLNFCGKAQNTPPLHRLQRFEQQNH